MCLCTLRYHHSILINGFVTIITWRVPLVKQKLFTLPEHLSCSPVFSGVRVARSLVFNVVFVDPCLSLCPFLYWPLYCLSVFELRLLDTSLAYLILFYLSQLLIFNTFLPLTVTYIYEPLYSRCNSRQLSFSMFLSFCKYWLFRGILQFQREHSKRNESISFLNMRLKAISKVEGKS